jgi:hypothetical protein
MTRHWASAALLPTLLFLTYASPAGARTWYVEADRSGQAPTIEAGLDSVAYGDTVLVGPGIYSCDATCGAWLRLKSGLTLLAESGPSATMLDAKHNADTTICCRSVSDVLVEGFRIGSSECGCFTEAVVLINSDVRVSGLWIDCYPSTGIYVWAGRTEIEDCRITFAYQGIRCQYVEDPDDLVIRNCNLSSCGIGIECSEAACYIDADSILFCNIGISLGPCSPARIHRCAILHNGSGIFMQSQYPDDAPGLGTAWSRTCGNSIYANYCDVEIEPGASPPDVIVLPFTYWGTDCPDFERIFSDPAHVISIPWCDANHGEVFWECPQSAKPGTWGSIKAMYRR